MKNRKFVCIILCVVLFCSHSVTVLATNKTVVPPIPPISVFDDAESNTDVPRAVFEEIGNATYYTEITNTYTLVVGLVPNGTVDYSIKYNKNPNTVYSGILNTTVRGQSKRDAEKQLLELKDSILKNELPLTAKTFRSSTQQTRSDGDMIMSELSAAGWPSGYTNYLRETRTQNGQTGKLYHSLSYSFRSYTNWFAIATTTLSAVMALTQLPGKILLRIATFLLTAASVYLLASDVTITRYEAFAYENKELYVQDTYQYFAGRTVKWLATVGNIGAALEYQYDNKHSDFDNHNSLFSTAFYNYNN